MCEGLSSVCGLCIPSFLSLSPSLCSPDLPIYPWLRPVHPTLALCVASLRLCHAFSVMNRFDDFSVKTVSNVSIAAGGLLQWVIAMLEYYEVWPAFFFGHPLSLTTLTSSLSLKAVLSFLCGEVPTIQCPSR